jgi:hypothetical protein
MPTIPSRVQTGQYGGKNAAGGVRVVPQRVILQKGPAQGLEHTDRQSQRIQQSILQATQSSKAFPLGAGNNLEGLNLTSGLNVLQHGLPQAWRSAWLHSQNAGVTWRFENTPQYPATEYLLVVVSGNVSCQIWVC